MTLKRLYLLGFIWMVSIYLLFTIVNQSIIILVMVEFVVLSSFLLGLYYKKMIEETKNAKK